MARLIVWGAGELGGRVARSWVDGPVRAYTRSTDRHAALRSDNISCHRGAPERTLADDVVLLALPGSDRQAMAIAQLSDQPAPKRAVLISTTGYYGLARGTVDEDTRPGRSERAQRAAATEAAFHAWAPGGVIVRCGGLYRPGRGPLNALAVRKTVPKGPPNKTLALMHYDDAAAATLAALTHPDPDGIYLAVTPPCPSRRDFYLAACVLLDFDLPTFGRALVGKQAEYDVRRLRRDLLPEPAHPKWQTALVPG
ncbi:MAG: nucleoside-diphosphate-sugar epimerase [Bradymonadia bacterium]|jgi:nucleoside-diphosphate-sugar epimerase